MSLPITTVGFDPSLPAKTFPVAQPNQGCPVTRDTMVSTISTSISESFEVFVRKGFRAFVEAFNAVHCLQNQDANLLIGHETVAGIVRGVDVTGGLIFEDKGGTRIVTSGEVSLRPA